GVAHHFGDIAGLQLRAFRQEQKLDVGARSQLAAAVRTEGDDGDLVFDWAEFRSELNDQAIDVVRPRPRSSNAYALAAAIASVYSLRTWSPAAVFQSVTNWS